MGGATLILAGHSLAALLFGMLALSRLREGGAGLPRVTFVVALAATALWALAVAGIDARDVATRIAESLRNVAWLGFMYALLRQDRARGPGIAATATYLVVAIVSMTAAGIAIAESLAGPDAATLLAGFATARLLLRMMVAVAALVLVHNLHALVAPAARGGIRLVLIGLAAMWSVDLVLYSTAYLGGGWPVGLVAGRGIAMALLVPVLAVASHRNGDWTLQLSRTVAFQSLSLGAIGLYVVAMVLATGAFTDIGGAYSRLVQVAFVAGSTATLLGIAASPWLRAWVKVKVAKHLFRHRYDYRHEWLRFTATLGRPEADAAALDLRVVKAIADLTDSPAGLLLVATGEGLDPGAGWNWDAATAGAGAGLAAHLATGQIVALDAAPTAASDDAAALVPQWLLDRPGAWAIVPLVHLGKLTGAVVLARPALPRALDWEDFDLLRVAGAQAASYLAEARGASALAEAQRFDEFNRRFAFIIHDVKNLVSQLTLVARNAERHADNPAFRADMVATLKDSCGRMNELLARLSQRHAGRVDPVRPTNLQPIAERVAARLRFQHPIVVSGHDAVGRVDPARFEQLLTHLVQNAIEASPSDRPVTIAVGGGSAHVTVAVIDLGCGMTPAFVRDELFRPFASSKPGGFGIGAFEARQLAEAMAGTIEVVSRPGEGSRFSTIFPAAVALERAA